ncbi:helix-turn-helix transcriptional regulator [Streptomonospora algeriensis]
MSERTCACELVDYASIDPTALEKLTEREIRVLGLLAAGHSNRGISTSLGVSERTVKAHVTRILEKLQVQSRLQAALAFIIDRWKTCPSFPLAFEQVDADAPRPE